MLKFTNPKLYTITVSVLLFGFGIAAFAFRSYFNIADKYLFLSLVLGFWGILSFFGSGE